MDSNLASPDRTKLEPLGRKYQPFAAIALSVQTPFGSRNVAGYNVAVYISYTKFLCISFAIFLATAAERSSLHYRGNCG